MWPAQVRHNEGVGQGSNFNGWQPEDVLFISVAPSLLYTVYTISIPLSTVIQYSPKIIKDHGRQLWGTPVCVEGYWAEYRYVPISCG